MKTIKLFFIFLVALAVLGLTACPYDDELVIHRDPDNNGPDEPKPPEPPEYNYPSSQEYLVGVSYFAGWWDDVNNGWFYPWTGLEWLTRFPGRQPLLGKYITQETLNKEIIAASDHHVDFFQMLWYPLYNDDDEVRRGIYLNDGIKYFMESPENYRMRFYLEYCNGGGFGLKNLDVWKQACADLVEIMKHPAYLKVGGKAMFKIHNIHTFYVDEAGAANAADWLQYLRDLAEEEGVGELLIGAGAGESSTFPASNTPREQVDYTNFYMGLTTLPKNEEEHSYDVLAGYALEIAERWTNPAMPFPNLPYIPSSWNPKPWVDPVVNPNIYFTFPTRTQWNKMLTDMKDMLDDHSNLRIPDGTPNGQKMLNIYCWNEYGEGGIVSPTVGEGFMKLQEIKRVFPRLP